MSLLGVGHPSLLPPGFRYSHLIYSHPLIMQSNVTLPQLLCL